MKTLNPQKSEELWNEIKNIEYLVSKLGGCVQNPDFVDAENIVRTKQYGCDYNHIWDVDIKNIKDPKEAYEVFNDAEDLFEQLNS